MAPSKVEAYGADPLQYGELRLPAGPGPFPVAVIIHGGCWTRGFATLRYMAPLASALAAKGVATWNVEYRQLGDNEAGWPGTFLDWAAATDHLRALAQKHPLDLSRVIAVGHSAGAQAALWLAARGRLPPTSAIRSGDPLKISAVVAIDGPVDLKAFIALDKFVCGKPVVSRLLGGSPEEVPGRYRESSPIELLRHCFCAGFFHCPAAGDGGEVSRCRHGAGRQGRSAAVQGRRALRHAVLRNALWRRGRNGNPEGDRPPQALIGSSGRTGGR